MTVTINGSGTITGTNAVAGSSAATTGSFYFGGYWSETTNSGSRCSAWNHSPATRPATFRAATPVTT